MAEKTVGYVELEWTCPRCQTRNPGPQKFCNGCGAPQPADVAFEQKPQETLITSATEIARAQAGPDVHCPYCGGRNPAGVKFCGDCGGDLAGAKARQSGRVLGAYRSEAAQDFPCPACGTLNPGDAQTCMGCGAPLAAPTPARQPAPAQTPAKGKGVVKWAVAGVGLLCLFSFLAFIVLSNRTKDLTGSVAGVEWQRSIAIEAQVPVEHEAWAGEIPAGAEKDACHAELRRTQDQPAPRSTEVCGTPYTKDTGSGYGKVVQDCVYQVYDDLCTYTAPEWQTVDHATMSRTDLSPEWPQVSLAAGQRQGAQEENYRVTFQAGSQDYTYTPESAAEFSQFQAGSRWVLKVNTFGAVVAADPAK